MLGIDGAGERQCTVSCFRMWRGFNGHCCLLSWQWWWRGWIVDSKVVDCHVELLGSVSMVIDSLYAHMYAPAAPKSARAFTFVC
jgi:hypothetical protein